MERVRSIAIQISRIPAGKRTIINPEEGREKRNQASCAEKFWRILYGGVPSPLEEGEGHDCRDAGGRATQGAVAEGEG
jgi:hypothetical protein